MRNRYVAHCIAFLLVFMPVLQAKTPRVRAIDVKVHFLAASTLLRGDRNQDTWLAEINEAGSSAPTLIRLIDEYPAYQIPLSKKILQLPEGSHLLLVRDERCDLQLGRIPLRAAPGDPIAILQIEMHYQPTEVQLPPADTVIPCYRRQRTGKE